MKDCEKCGGCISHAPWCKQPKKHKHHDVLIAIAEGKEIQYYSDVFYWQDCNPEYDPDPITHPNTNFRIKPEPKPDIIGYGRAYFEKSNSPEVCPHRIYLDRG
jgi:hypothetical protein